MIWPLIWLNKNVVIINSMFQLLNIYIYIYKLVEHKFYARVCAVGDSTALFLLLMDSSIKTSNIPTDQKGKKNIK